MDSIFLNAINKEQKERKEGEILIEQVAKELKDKYPYDQLDIFIDYLASFKRILIDFKGNMEKIENEYIEIEIVSLSAQSSIKPEVLSLICEEFKKRIKDKGIHLVANEILACCPKDDETDEYLEFIEYLIDISQKIHTIFKEEHDSNIEALKNRLVEEKIMEFSKDGVPTKDEMEKIYADFERKLEEKGLKKY